MIRRPRLADIVALHLSAPMTVEEIAAVSGLRPSDVQRGLGQLVRQGRLRVEHVAVWSLSEPVAQQALPVWRVA